MNRVEKGCRRDRQLLALIDDYGALATRQACALVFDGKYALRQAQRRLKRMAELGRLNRCRLDAHDDFTYYNGRRSGRLEHLVAVNWVRIWLGRSLRSWERFEAWQYELRMGDLQADGFWAARNTMTGELRCLFVELDRAASGNAWNKALLYSNAYESDAYAGAWWADQARRFPAVLCVTDGSARAAAIGRAIERDNRSGLEFRVRLLQDVIGEVLS